MRRLLNKKIIAGVLQKFPGKRYINIIFVSKNIVLFFSED